MIHLFWRLSERTQDNLGLAFAEDGLFLGRTALIERHDGHFAARDRREIEQLLSRAYGIEVRADTLMQGLATVAAALNASDRCLAHIAAVHLRLPDLVSHAARDGMEAEDIFIKSAGRTLALHRREIYKASPDDPKHPGWPAGTEDGLGGKFRPKTESEIAEETKSRIRRLALRRALRIGALTVLRTIGETSANVLPFVGTLADVVMLVDLANTASEFRKLKIDADAAITFVQHGSYSLDELQIVSASEYEEFSSYDEFYKDLYFAKLLEKRFGSAGDGNQYHHIVTQGGLNDDKIAPERLQNTDNIIPLPTLLHEAVSAAYLEPAPDNPNMSLYQWLQTQPYDVQREYGLKILRRLHILK